MRWVWYLWRSTTREGWLADLSGVSCLGFDSGCLNNYRLRPHALGREALGLQTWMEGCGIRCFSAHGCAM